MTAKVLVSPEIKLKLHGLGLKKLGPGNVLYARPQRRSLPKNNNNGKGIPFQIPISPIPSPGKLVKAKSKSVKTVRSPKGVRRPTNRSSLKLKLKIDLKAKRHPKIFQKSLLVKIQEKQIRNVLLRQVLVEEKSSLRMLGVAVFYSNLLNHLREIREMEEENEEKRESCYNVCPFCKCDNSASDFSTNLSVDLKEKLERDVTYLLNYAKSSSSRKEKEKYFKALETHNLLGSSSDVNYLNTSESFSSLSALVTSRTSSRLRMLEDLEEIKQGKKEALRLLKVQLLKSRKCGVCEENVESFKLPSVLTFIDKTLSSLS